MADSAADQAVEYAADRNSLFNSDVSSLTRPSDPKNTELRNQFIDMTQSIDLAAGPESAAKADNNMLEAIESQQMQDHFSTDLVALQRRGTVQMDIDTSSLNKGGILGSGAESDRVRGTKGGGLETVNEDIDEPEENAQQKITTLIAKKNVDISEADLQMMVALRQLRSHFLNGQFRAAHNLLTDRFVRDRPDETQLHFYNVCQLYVLHKLKEFNSAKHVAQDLLRKMDRQTSLSLEK